MAECVFCKIVKGEIPSAKVYEDGKTMAFLDIKPVNDGHALVIPKEHYADIFDAPEAILIELASAVKKVAEAVMKATEAHGITVIESNRKAAGQAVQHLHFHIIPRYDNDGLKHWPQHDYKEGVMEEVAGRIRERL